MSALPELLLSTVTWSLLAWRTVGARSRRPTPGTPGGPEDEAQKTAKNFAYWEAFSSSAGYPASLATLMQLAALYQMAVSDLLAGAGNFRHLDENYPGRDVLEPADTTLPDRVASDESGAIPSAP